MRKSKRRLRHLVLAAMVLTLASWSETAPVRMRSAAVAQEEAAEAVEATSAPVEINPTAAATATTTKDPQIPVDELKLLVKPLTLAELEVEAQGWLLLLQGKVREITNQEIAIKRKNRKIDETEDAAQAIAEAEKDLEAAQEAGSGSVTAIKKTEEAQAALEEAQEAILEAEETEASIQEDEALKETVDSTVEGDAEKDEEVEALLDSNVGAEDAEQAQENIEGAAALLESELGIDSEPDGEGDEGEFVEGEEGAFVEREEGEFIEGEEGAATAEGEETPELEATDEKIEQLEEVEAQLEAAAEAEEDIKQELVVEVTQLQTEQTAVADRFKVILDAMDLRGGDTGSYRQYISAISSIELDVSDTQGLAVRLMGWARSEEGGLRWARNFGLFMGIVAGSVVVAWIGGRILNNTLKRTQLTSNLMREFVLMVFRRGTVTIGVLLGLTALEVSLGPLLALLGGASFILAFALQSNLGNLASGLMLMVSKPFDVGDEVKVGDMWAMVDSITLANTKFMSFKGEAITVPNNTVWNSNIYNLTHAPTRKIRHNIMFELDADIPYIKALVEEVLHSHPKVLKDEWIGTYVYWFQEDYIPITIGCAATKEEFWTVWEDTLIMLQERFKKEGIKFCNPTHDIRVEYGSKGALPALPPSMPDSTPSFAKNS